MLLLRDKMVLRMKNFNILGVHWKIRLLGVGGSRKTNVEGGLPKKGALVSLPIYGGDLARKRGGGVWGGVDTPMHTMNK